MTTIDRVTAVVPDASHGSNVTDAPGVAQHVPGFPIVGIGASAGGLGAFTAFFSGMPSDTDPGMAFVLVQHLAPDHTSILADLLRRHTRMQVFQVEDGMAVKPNCAYVIPPNRDMVLISGTLHLKEPSAPRGHRLPVDSFFRSLAQDQHERAICVVLSGTGSDGTLGVRAIKGEGGMAMAQNPASTEYDGMPRGAIATGLVDFELPPAEMPAQIMAYVAHAFGKLPRAESSPAPQGDHALTKIFMLLRGQTGHDFSQYKASTIHRRVERRMAVHRIETMDGYLEYAQRAAGEVDALFHDLLIGVTSFFRDPEAFEALEQQVIPALFVGKSEGAAIRVWSAACSTGEEAYSIAILLKERVEAMKQRYKVQVFATDIDGPAIVTARAGMYPAGIAADVSPERLARFFVADSDGSAYRVHKSIRDMVVFSEQDLIRDPPFSKLALVSCRNLLIYLGGDLQKKIMPLFHYSLNPGGFLFLGTAETVGGSSELFATLDRKSKVYQRKASVPGAPREAAGRYVPPVTAADLVSPPSGGETAGTTNHPLRERTDQAVAGQAARPDRRAASLAQAWWAQEERRRTTIAELDPVIEKPVPSTEAMRSVNEELQSTNEELETSKEELQSVNEELVTVNAELQTNVADLSRANNDMSNLLAGTGIGTVFVDHQRCILRFTPSATRIINVTISDVGRPVSHIVSNLVGYDRLAEDVQAVLDTLVTKELEVQTKAGAWYSMRIRPYRTLENVIEGAVIAFVDVTAMKKAQDQVRLHEERMRVAVQAFPAVVSNQDTELRYTWIYNPNPTIFAEHELGKTDTDLLCAEDAASLTAIKRTVLDSGVGTRQVVRTTVAGKPRLYDVTVEPLRGAGGDIIGITSSSTDLNDRMGQDSAGPGGHRAPTAREGGVR